jgi:uncharacterized protein
MIQVAGRSIEVLIADTPTKLQLGLSGYPGLKENEGMLFVFDKADYHGIWMKDMLFSIDILWLDDDLNVVDAHTNVSPDTFPDVFQPKTPARFVLETNGGWYQQ